MQEVTEVITVALGGAGGQAAAAVGCVFWVGEDQRVSGDEGGLKVSEFCALCWGDLCVGCKACSIRWAGLGWAGLVRWGMYGWRGCRGRWVRYVVPTLARARLVYVVARVQLQPSRY